MTDMVRDDSVLINLFGNGDIIISSGIIDNRGMRQACYYSNDMLFYHYWWRNDDIVIDGDWWWWW